jgi:hypothetical protein
MDELIHLKSLGDVVTSVFALYVLLWGCVQAMKDAHHAT